MCAFRKKGMNFNMDENLNTNNANNSGNTTNTLALVGMILGILGIVCCWIPILGLATAIVGLILGIKGLQNSKNIANKGRGFGIAGISCGSVGIVLSIIYTIVWIVMAIAVKETVNAVSNEYNSYKRNLYSYNTNYNYNSKSLLDDYDF